MKMEKLVDNGWAEVEGYKRAIEYANQHGSVVVASAGNDSVNVANKQELNNFLKQKYEKEGKIFTGVGIEAPGELPGVVTVSSTCQPDNVLYSLIMEKGSLTYLLQEEIIVYGNNMARGMVEYWSFPTRGSTDNF